MARSAAARIEHELMEKITLLSPAQKRELLDFASFLSTRRQVEKPSGKATFADFAGIIGIAPGGAGETDISVNHDKYLYGDDAI